MIFQLFYPSFCRSCNVLVLQRSVFCDDCLQKVKPVVSVYLPITPKKPLKLFAISAYKNPIRPLILKKSYSDILASKQLAQLIFDMTPIKDLNFDYIVHIPLHWTRYAKRGYNQSAVMAKVLSKKLKIPHLNVLKRKKRTIFQSKLSFEKRQENLKDAFSVRFRYKQEGGKFLKDKKILLVDDLCTTGATLKNAARILLKFEPQSISAVVACRVI